MKAQFRLVGIFFVMILLAAVATSCIRSRVRITSEPSGANVRFHGQDWGQTPVTVPFIWYWHYDIDLEKQGYQPVHAMEYFRTPPYAIFPLDFFAELLPIPITDTRKRHYTLQPESAPTPTPTPAQK